MGVYDDLISDIQPSSAGKTSGQYDDLIKDLQPANDPNAATISRDYPLRRAVSNYLLRPVIEGGAMTLGAGAGAILGSPAGPVGAGLGALAGGAAMYPPANTAANAVDKMLGIENRQAPPAPILDQAKQVGKQFQTGAMIETGGRLLKPAVKGIEAIVKKAVPIAFGPSKEAVAARIADKDAIANAASHDALAQKLPETLNTVKSQITELEKAAQKTLSKSNNPQDGAIPVKAVEGLLNSLEKGLRVGKAVVGPAAERATSVINGIRKKILGIEPSETVIGPYGEKIAQQPAYISQSNLRDLIRSFDNNIDWTSQELAPLNTTLEKGRTIIDSILKHKNPAYAQAIAPEAEKIRLLKSVQRKFNVSSVPGEGFTPGTATATNLATATRDKKGVYQQTLRDLADATGDDYLRLSKNATLADQFKGGVTQGSRRAFSGAAIGGALGAGLGNVVGEPAAGAAIGSNLGTLAGMAVDTSGREMGAHVIDAYLKAKPWLQKIPLDVAVRLIATGVLDEKPAGGNKP